MVIFHSFVSLPEGFPMVFLTSNILHFRCSNGGRSALGTSRSVTLAAARGEKAHAAGRPQGRARGCCGAIGAMDGPAQNRRSLGKTQW